MKANHKLEHIIFNSWKRKNPGDTEQKILVGVSGGSDSMVLLKCLLKCFSKDRLVVVHCHHGPGNNISYRNQAQQLVESFCKNQRVSCEVVKSEKVLNSESELREFRFQAFKVIADRFGIQIVALAHHRNDWLENQLIKLIRGSSFSGLRKSFQWSQLKDKELLVWRPLVSCIRSELDVYRQENKISFVLDPSNKNSKYFRNWIREEWLPMLEKARPGAVNRLALSLINSIAEITPPHVLFPWDFKTHSISFLYFLSLPDSERLRCLAFFVQSEGIKNVKTSQLKEIVRQLDKDSVRYHIRFKTFECLVNAEQLILRKHD